MKIKKLEWRNIGPFGNKLQSIELPDEGGLWMVLGKNGNGKSFFVNLPKILYYGKLDRFKKGDIANRINHHGWIRGTDKISPTTKITIERNFSPSDLIVYKNGEDIGKSGITNYQDFIDLEVTGLPYNIFSNIISLSVNDFKSFISMTPHNKREIIDKLFAMEVINQMNELVKRDIREIKINIEIYDREIASFKNNVDVAVKELQKLKEKVNQDNTEQIEKLAKKLKEYEPKLKEGYDKKKKYENKQKEINKSYSRFQHQRSNLNNDIKNLKKEIDLFNQEKCPTCGTPFLDSTFGSIKEELQKKYNSKTSELEELNSNENKYTSALKTIENGLEVINNFIINVQTTYNIVEKQIDELKINKPKEFNSIKNIISENTEKIKSKGNEKQEYDEKYKYLSVLEQLYSDTGVKKRILESYLPTLNKEIFQTLHDLHFPYNLSFNSDFEPEIQHLGIEISVDTLSTGEKKRADLAILISIIRMLKRKYPSLNIFMLDEVLSSVDGDGIYDIIGLLQKISKEMNMNIFIINHSLLPIEHFDYRIEIEKNAGFSDLKVEKLNN